jgi:hypothetical protein
MFKNIIEYRETQQYRKDQKQKQKLKYGLVLFAILGVLLIATTAVEAMTPTKPPTASTTVATTEQQELQEIQAFATAVTKPLDQLTKEDLDLVDAHDEDPCYADNVKLPSELMVQTIKACKAK